MTLYASKIKRDDQLWQVSKRREYFGTHENIIKYIRCVKKYAKFGIFLSNGFLEN